MSSPEQFDYYKRQHLSPLVPRTKKAMLFCTICVATIEPITTAMESSIMGSINSLPQYKKYFNINNGTLGLNSAAIWIGLILTLPFIQQMADGFGRRKTIFISLGLMVVGIILTACSVHSAMFVIGRIILGMSSGIFGSSASVLVAEVSPPHQRGLILGLFHSFYYAGSMISSGVTYGTRNMQSNWSWRIPLIIQIIPTILCFSAIMFAPESPRWLVMHGKADEAKEIFYILEGDNAERADELVEEVLQSIAKENKFSQGLGLWKRQFKLKSNWHRAFILLNLGNLAELGGSNIATYYFNILLNSAGVKDVTTQLQVAIIRAAFCLVCALFGCWTFDIIGRKKQALISTTGLIVCLFILGGLIKKYGDSDNIHGKYGSIAMMFMFTGFYSYCYSPMLYLYPPELYTNPNRVVGNTILKACDYGSGLFATFMLPIGMSNMGWKFYILTGGYDIIFLPCIAFLWVETKGLPLEKVCELFGDNAEELEDVQSNATASGALLNDEESSVISVSVSVPEKT